MRIGQFAALAGVSHKTLRFYDERGLFKPARRDVLTGYREYEAHQLGELLTLLALRELGLPLEALRGLSKAPGARRAALERARAKLERTVDLSARSLAWIDAELAHQRTAVGGVVLRRRPGFRVVTLRSQLGEARDVAELERALAARVPEAWRGRRRGTLWHRCAGDEGPIEAECFLEVEPGAAVRGLTVRTLEPVTAACGFTADEEASAHAAFDDVKRWVHAHRYQLAAPKRELFWGQTLEVQFPVAGPR